MATIARSTPQQFYFFIIAVMFLSVHAQNISKSNDTKLLVILLNGFRWDYLQRIPDSGGFSKFKDAGSMAHHLMPVYPSQTYPNLYSILTGLYPENHGFVSQVMYDPNHSTIFYSYDGESGDAPYWWNQTDPIWTAATKLGIRTSVYSWPGCAVQIHGVQPGICTKKTVDHEADVFESNLQDAQTRLAKNETDFALVYTDYPDVIGHHFGPQSREINESINKLDTILDLLATSIRTNRNLGNLNVIILSDHGITNYPAPENLLSIFGDVSPDDVEFVTGFGTEVGVYPKADKINKVYQQLQKLKMADVWKQPDIPETLHVKWNIHTPPILAVAKPGYAFARIHDEDKQKPMSTGIPKIPLGLKGYNASSVQEMNGIFLVSGPGFQKRMVHMINIVDVYNMMTCILNITGHPNNGSWANICPFMANDCNGTCGISAQPLTTSPGVMWLFMAILSLFVTHKII